MTQFTLNTDLLLDALLQNLGLVVSYFFFRTSLAKAAIIQQIYLFLRKDIFLINEWLNRRVYNYFNPKNKWKSLEEIIQSDKKVLCVLTGGSHGLGKQLYTKLSKKYCKKYSNFEMLIIDKEPMDYDDKCAENIFFIQHDFINRIENKLDKYKSKDYDYKIVINNCGTRFEFHDFLETWKDSSRFLELLNINSLSACDLLSIFEPDYIVTISSILSMISPKNGFLYSSSKNIIANMHESYVQIENKKGMLVLPGQLKGTDLFKKFEPLFKSSSKKFFSPLVSTDDLSDEIIEGLEGLLNKVIVRPYYGFFIKILTFMPYWLQKPLRVLSSVDEVEN